ncbi:MAG: glycosyltransferase family 4 protein [Nocardioidaceae bacterium]|nr:glycosyltransferase family 4 protein [Nocardioidaceae bacterium]
MTTRGRVVMLVHKAVEGDSRVQKQARSAAERGWDVVLLGRSPDGHEHVSHLGEAEVRLVPVPVPLKQRPYETRAAWWRAPLAYGTGRVGRYRVAVARAGQVEQTVRRAAASAAGEGGRDVSLVAARVLTAGYAKATRVRLSRTVSAQRRRRLLDRPLDRATTALRVRLGGVRAWRTLHPAIHDLDLALGPVVDELRPDVVHANDFTTLGIAVTASWRARAEGRRVAVVWDAHEFLPGITAWDKNPRWMPAQQAYEAEHAPYADAVVTVSPRLAELLQQQHDLPVLPRVVLNAPEAEQRARAEGVPRDLRTDCGIGDDDPLLVYSGGAAPQRGLGSLVDALADLPGVHLALVLPASDRPYPRSLVERATALGVDDRLHLLPYVEVDEVPRYLSGADVGVIPILHVLNHEIALITKFFEYAHARIPVVVSDVETMAAAVRDVGHGEVFVADDAAGLAAAVRRVLDDPERYRAAYDRPGLLDAWSWERQVDVLDSVYAEVTAR